MVPRTGAFATYRKQSLAAVRSSMKGVLLFATVGLACFWFWGNVWYVKLLFGLAALFLLVSVIEWGSAAAGKAANRGEHRATPEMGFSANDDFERVSTRDEGDRFERRLVVSGHPICIRIPIALLSEVKPQATALVAGCDDLLSKFEHFKSMEAESNPRYADEIRGLEIQTLYFGSRKHPNLVEVFFTEESGGETWSVLWDQERRKFQDLKQI